MNFQAAHGGKKSTSRVQFQDPSGPASTSYDRSSSASSTAVSASLLSQASSGAAAAALRDSHAPHDAPIFTLETLERNANRGGGSITTGAAANNCVVVGTSRGTCVFYDFADGTSVEVDCAAGGEVVVGRVWLDPTARHAIVTLHDALGRPVDTVYFRPGTDPRARPLPAVAAARVAVTAVGWHVAQCTALAALDVLVGTADGFLFELCLETAAPGAAAGAGAGKSKSKPTPETLFRKLLALTEVRELGLTPNLR